MKDWRGTEIEVGDVILYPVKHSTHVAVNEAIVTELGDQEGRSGPEPYVIALWQQASRYGRAWRVDKPVKLIALSNVTVIAKGRW